MTIKELIRRAVQEKKKQGQIRPLKKLVREEGKIMSEKLSGYKSKKESSTLKGITRTWLTAVVTAFLTAFAATEPQLIAVIQGYTPDMLDPAVIWAVPAVGSLIAGFFGLKARKGRIDATVKIDPNR